MSVVDGACHFGPCNNYDIFVMPHVRFDTVEAQTPVPAPASMALLGAGLGLARRRRG